MGYLRAGINPEYQVLSTKYQVPSTGYRVLGMGNGMGNGMGREYWEVKPRLNLRPIVSSAHGSHRSH